MNLRSAALTSTLVYLLLLTLRAYPVLAPNALAGDPATLPIAMTAPTARIETPETERRAPDQTFLTYPEWFLVFSPDELAGLLETRPASDFPWFGHIVQLWQGAVTAVDVTRGRYPTNSDYLLMIGVIGVSTTLEYGAEGMWENAFGAFTAALGPRTAEDRFWAASTRRYVDFLNVGPWFRFDYIAELRTLWGSTPWLGPNPLRSIERRYWLSTVLLAKAIYGAAMNAASTSMYGVESSITAVVVDRRPAEPLPPGVEMGDTLPDGSTHLRLPRYTAFAEAARALSSQGVDFVEIAGNRGAILVSLRLPTADRAEIAGQALVLTQPILTQAPLQRFAVAVPVDRLSELLRRFPHAIEHVYDY